MRSNRLPPSIATATNSALRFNPPRNLFRAAVPFREQTTWTLTGLSPHRDHAPNRADTNTRSSPSLYPTTGIATASSGTRLLYTSFRSDRSWHRSSSPSSSSPAALTGRAGSASWQTVPTQRTCARLMQINPFLAPQSRRGDKSTQILSNFFSRTGTAVLKRVHMTSIPVRRAIDHTAQESVRRGRE